MGGGLIEVVSVADFDFSDVRPLSNAAHGVAAFGDFDRDGKPDVLVSAFSPDRISSFASASPLIVLPIPRRTLATAWRRRARKTHARIPNTPLHARADLQDAAQGEHIALRIVAAAAHARVEVSVAAVAILAVPRRAVGVPRTGQRPPVVRGVLRSGVRRGIGDRRIPAPDVATAGEEQRGASNR